ncbi:MAG: HAMP domain-containing protein [Spirochaetales bacterium]|nr:HAMP domain-containing protein [Spirochaetales bacterium]
MNIRGKIILIVLPLIITPLLLTGVISALSARNGITGVATGFLRFKSEQLLNYADGQWAILEENDLQDSPPFREAAQSAVAAFARNLLRSPTELILALDREGSVAMQTGQVDLAEGEADALRRLVQEGEGGWQNLQLGGQARVAHLASFAPFGWTVIVSEKREVFYSTINAIITRVALILSVSLAVSVVLLLFFSGVLTRPLRDMAGVMTEIISTGDLTRRVEVVYGDETGKLGHTFNLMTSELERLYGSLKHYALEAVLSKNEAVAARENEHKLRNVFQKYVPTEVIDRYIARPEEMLRGEDRVLAVLFSDIRSFTAIAEPLRPDELVELLNQYFSLMVEIVMRRKGIVDKYIGDAVMALFGAPARHEDDALQSVLAGLEMLDDLKDFNRIQEGAGRTPWRIGIGINYGTVTVGNIGSEKKMDYTVIGDGVNLAQRLESLTKKYAEPLIVSEAVEYKVRQRLPCRLLDRVVVKGRSQGIGIYAPCRKLSPEQAKAWGVYHQGTSLYYERRFDEAAAHFRKTLQLLPQDSHSLRFLERCQRYANSPPSTDWTGAELMAEK